MGESQEERQEKARAKAAKAIANTPLLYEYL